MRMVRVLLLSAVVWAGSGLPSAHAQFFRPNPFMNTPLANTPFTPSVGFMVNGFRFSSGYNYNFNIASNGVNFSYSYSGPYPLYNGGFPMYSYGGINPYTYAALNSTYSPIGSYIQGGVGNYSGPPLTDLGRQDYGANVRPGVFNEWKWDREKGARAEERRQQASQETLDRSLNQPSNADIASGAALNAVLTAVEAAQGKLKDVAAITIPPEALRSVNISRGVSSATPSLLGDGGQLAWPRALQKLSAADTVRNDITERVAQAYRQAAAGKPVDVATLKDLEASTRQLESVIGQNVSKLGFDEHRDAKRFLKSLDDAVAFLKLPDAGDWLPGKLTAKVTSAQELVKAMAAKSARFAPSAPGGERAYAAIHRALVEFYRQAAPQVASSK